MSFITNIKGAFASSESADRGSLVETVLLIAGFAVVAILVVTWIGNAVAGQSANVATCIAGANQSNASAANANCTTDTVGVSSATTSQIASGKSSRF